MTTPLQQTQQSATPSRSLADRFSSIIGGKRKSPQQQLNEESSAANRSTATTSASASSSSSSPSTLSTRNSPATYASSSSSSSSAQSNLPKPMPPFSSSPPSAISSMQQSLAHDPHQLAAPHSTHLDVKEKEVKESKGFFGSLAARALSSLAAHRHESAEKSALKAAQLERINTRMCMRGTKEDSTDAEIEKVFKTLDHYLTTYHEGRYLLLDVSSSLASCPENLLTSRLTLEFGVNDELGPLDAAARIAAAASRWWSAEERPSSLSSSSSSSSSNSSSQPKNMIVLSCNGYPRYILAACILYSSLEFTDILLALHSVLLSTENRLMASLHMRNLLPSHRAFLSNYSLIHRFDPSFHVPKVWLHEMRIHRLPQFEEDGTRLLIAIIANRTQFLYTSQAQGGGHIWIPTRRNEPLTVCIPMAFAFSGEASIKVWHLPEQASVSNPRQMVFETKLHSSVLALPCWRMQGVETNSKGEMVPATGGQTIQTQPVFLSVPTDGSLPTVIPISSSSSASSTSSPPANSPDQTYPLHRLFLRRAELDLNLNSDLGLDPHVMLSDVQYDRNFRVSFTATPMEEGKYKQEAVDEWIGSYGTTAAVPLSATPTPTAQATTLSPSQSKSASSSAKSSARSSPIAELRSLRLRDPSPEVDLAQLAKAYNATPSPTHAEAIAAKEFAIECEKEREAREKEDKKREKKEKKLLEKENKKRSKQKSGEFAVSSSSPSPLSSAESSPMTRSPASSDADLFPPPFMTPEKRKIDGSDTSSSTGFVSIASIVSPPMRSPSPDASMFALAAASSSPSPSPTPTPSPAFIAPSFTIPANARSTAGLRFYPEDKHGAERAETCDEVSRRQRWTAERSALDQAYGPGNWRRAGGVVWTTADGERRVSAVAMEIQSRQGRHGASSVPAMVIGTPPQDQATAELHRLLNLHNRSNGGNGGSNGGSLGSSPSQPHGIHIPRSSRSSSGATASNAAAVSAATARVTAAQQGLTLANAAMVEAEAEHSRLTAAAAATDGSAPSPAVLDESVARLLAAQYAREDADELHRQTLAAQQQIIAATQSSSSDRHHGTSSRRHRTSSGNTTRSHRSRSSSSQQPQAASAASAGQLSSTPTDDESFARALQQQFDTEALAGSQGASPAGSADRHASSQHSLSSLIRAQGNLNPDALHYDQRLALEELMGSHQSRAAKSGASDDLINQLPEFRLDGGSKYLQEECQICQEQYQQGEVLRQLQCLHPFHRDCIDPWLRTNRTCAICKMAVHAS